MLRLCRKDLIASWPLWVLMLVVFALYGVLSFHQDVAFRAVALALVLGLTVLTLIVEDQYRTETFFCSLPLRRRTIVAAKYLLSGFLALFGGGFFFACRFLLSPLIKMRDLGARPPSLFASGELSIFLALSAILLSLYYPLYFRFGLGKGAFWFVIILLGFLLIDNGVRLLNPAKAGLSSLFPLQSLSGIKSSLGLPLFLVMTLTLVAGLLFVSIKLSIRFYERRDL